ncbi:hypothetical protein Memar_2256 [Methanoculleus marisnigri JR1]|uniref:Uncharacterized protein n=1 Tax=Methanoculleus marisnigri (strain ATCC 35101 / DSM 1498 / JR1) TaxID=368407 RepID=A3CXS9_METMJ|nr:hypothetical protein Memar_2256 [Methanoculleus marisnigri JR1]
MRCLDRPEASGYERELKSWPVCCIPIFQSACVSGCSAAPHAYGYDDGPDDESNRSRRRPGWGWADDLLAVRDAYYRAHPKDSRALQKPQQAEKTYKSAEKCSNNSFRIHARSNAVF